MGVLKLESPGDSCSESSAGVGGEDMVATRAVIEAVQRDVKDRFAK